MFGSRIKIDKALLAKVKRHADLAGYSSVEEFVAHVLGGGVHPLVDFREQSFQVVDVHGSLAESNDLRI